MMINDTIMEVQSVQNLLILGTGQYGMVAKETAETMKCFNKIDFLDDNNPVAVGKLNDFAGLYPEYTHAVVAIGNPDVRLKLLQDIQASPLQLATLIHPRSYVSPTAKIPDGCIIEPMAVVNAYAEL
jgi:UDP-3-O-[3-hydroxymyristoyl] glucosamine N-acyltransferase